MKECLKNKPPKADHSDKFIVTCDSLAGAQGNWKLENVNLIHPLLAPPIARQRFERNGTNVSKSIRHDDYPALLPGDAELNLFSEFPIAIELHDDIGYFGPCREIKLRIVDKRDPLSLFNGETDHASA